MFRTTLFVAALSISPGFTPVLTPAAAPSPVSAQPAFHCQVPCGIYTDSMRIDMLMEDAATIEKGMGQIAALSGDPANANQLVRWVMTKDAHAQSIQDTVASYWLAQRIKAPAADDDAARAKYYEQLSLLHGITVAAMKCKQTTTVEHVAKLRSLAVQFSGTYFTGEDLKHIQSDHGGEHR